MMPAGCGRQRAWRSVSGDSAAAARGFLQAADVLACRPPLVRSTVFPFQTMVMALDFVNSRAAMEEDLNLVLAEAHLHNIAPGFLANFELLHLILNELQVPLITMCAYDDVEAVSKLALGACFNLLKPLHTGSLNMLKTKALEHKPRKATPQGPILSRTKSRMVSSPTKRPQEMLILERNNLSNPESNEFQVPEVRKAHGCSKKPDRVQWIHELQEKFLDAVKVLGDKYATPQGIRKLMNVNGLTSKHIASHLQKHRLQQQKAKQGGQNQMNASTKSVSELIGLAHNAAITESIIPRVDADIEGVYPSRLWMHMSERPVTEAVASKTYTYTCTSGVYRDETKSVWDEYEKGLQEEFSASNRHWQQIGLPSSKRKLPAKNNVVVIDRSVSSGAPKAAGNNGNVEKINLLRGIEAASNNDSVGNINLPEGPPDVREEEISRWMSLLEGSQDQPNLCLEDPMQVDITGNADIDGSMAQEATAQNAPVDDPVTLIA
ncbi:hypothetical protein BAE44_0021059 [Dichanthelium oligosanthes]|uniref:HTH myb-type domain-containing protein n=1 Tax=Dichanthelium oligosanthes TaxID=888268 RepID=A0A1E5UYI0_9POAL|nr:hypothetical protein BAE44_0021059 [Dichanthelium oligosanthes]